MSASASPRCPSAGRTLAHDADARVWRVRPASGIDRFYGCARATGRVTRLDPRGGQVTQPATTLRLARATVAYQTLDFDLRPFRVVVRRLRSGRVLHRAYANRRHSAEGVGGPVRKLAVTRRGSVAWTASVECLCEGVDASVKGWEVHAIGRDDRPRVLDHGPLVRPESLRLIEGGRMIAWKHGSQTRRAPLR